MTRNVNVHQLHPQDAGAQADEGEELSEVVPASAVQVRYPQYPTHDEMLLSIATATRTHQGLEKQLREAIRDGKPMRHLWIMHKHALQGLNQVLNPRKKG